MARHSLPMGDTMFLKITNLILLLLSVGWLTRSPDWEPLIAFLTLLFGYLYQEFKDDKKHQILESEASHDKSIFHRYNEILSEKDFLYILNNDLSNNQIHYTDSIRFIFFLEPMESIAWQYINPRIKRDFEKFSTNFSQLKYFISTHFFLNEHLSGKCEDNWILSLYPEMKRSPDENKKFIYVNKEKELLGLIDTAINTYNNYRKTIKAELKI